MEALRLNGSRTLYYCNTLPQPEPNSGHCSVRVSKAGICSTDLGLINGLYEFQGTLGHEFVGVVEQGSGDMTGKRVVGNINIACQKCSRCMQGRQKHCANRQVLGIRGHDGAFATYLTLPEENLFLVPDSLTDEEATFTEPLAAALDISSKITVESNTQILIIGDGRMGQLIARVMGCYSDQLYQLGRHAEKLALLPEKVVATVLDSDLDKQQFDLVIECTGQPAGLQVAIEKVRPRGKIVLKSTYPGKVTIDTTRLVVDEIELLGSRCGNMQEALELMQRESLDLMSLVQAEFPLSAYEEAFKVAKRSIKVLFNLQRLIQA